MSSDIIFMHAPSVYDFRKKPIFYGPVSDVIPSSPVFEMYPIGFMTISSHLEAAGFKTRIVNIAVQMLKSEKFDVEKRIKGLNAKVFAIDLHWRSRRENRQLLRIRRTRWIRIRWRTSRPETWTMTARDT